MSEWDTVKIADIGRIIIGKTPKTKSREFWDGKVPFITPSDLQKTKNIYITERTITEKGLNSIKESVLPACAICVSCIGNLGYTAMTTRTSVSNQQINSIIPNSDFDNDFIYYLMRSLWNEFKHLEGQSTTLSILNKTLFSRIEVHVPDLIIQRKIAKILSSLDDKIELNAQINHNLEEQAKAIFDSMFPNISSGDNCVGDIIYPKRGKNLLSKDAVPGEVPVIAGGIEPATFHNTSNTTPPVLTISASGANAGYVSLWTIPVWSSDSSFIDSTMTDNVYFWYVLLKKRQKEIFDAQTGSAQPHIYPQHIAQMSLANITRQDIEIYTKTVTPIFDSIGENKKQNSYLEQLRDALLPKLMSGEIDVSQVEV